MTCSLSLRWCRTKAVHKCYAFRLKRNNLLSPTPDICSPLLALSVFIGAGQPLEHGQVRDSNLASMGPVVGLTYYYLPKFTSLASMFVCRFVTCQNFEEICKYVRLTVCLCVCLSVCLSVCPSITHERFDISSPNLTHICILGRYRSV